MKNGPIMLSVIMATALTASQAHALVFTDDIGVSDWELDTSVTGENPSPGAPYDGVFNDIQSGSIVFNPSSYTIADSGGTISVSILDAPTVDQGGSAITLTLGGVDLGTQTAYGNALDTLTYDLTTAAYNYLQSGGDQFTVTGDCMLTEADLTFNATANVPDGGTTAVLLGGVLTALGMIKRKMA